MTEKLNSWQRGFRSENKDFHVMPDNDKHDDSEDCFCKPSLSYRDEFTGKGVWVHKSDEEMAD